MPYPLALSAMAQSPDGKGVLLFGGHRGADHFDVRIVELHAGANSWKILNITLQNGRVDHIVIPLRDFF